MTCRRCKSLRKRIAEFFEDWGHAFALGAGFLALAFWPWVLGAWVSMSFIVLLLWGWLT